MAKIQNVNDLVEHPLSDEERRLVRDGGLAAQFIESAHWPQLIAELEKQCREALQAMFDCESSSDKVIASVWRRWKSAEKQRQRTEQHFMALKEDYEAAIESARIRQLHAQTDPADDLSGISDI